MDLILNIFYFSIYDGKPTKLFKHNFHNMLQERGYTFRYSRITDNTTKKYFYPPKNLIYNIIFNFPSKYNLQGIIRVPKTKIVHQGWKFHISMIARIKKFLLDQMKNLTFLPALSMSNRGMILLIYRNLGISLSNIPPEKP